VETDSEPSTSDLLISSRINILCNLYMSRKVKVNFIFQLKRFKFNSSVSAGSLVNILTG
jgi:hypothetical protein